MMVSLGTTLAVWYRFDKDGRLEADVVGRRQWRATVNLFHRAGTTLAAGSPKPRWRSLPVRGTAISQVMLQSEMSSMFGHGAGSMHNPD
jgi:hypothetical protein